MSNYDKEVYDPGSTHWHLDKRVNVGHLIATILLAASVFAWGGGLDKRVVVVEEKAAQHDKDNARQDEAIRAGAALLREELRDVKEGLREINRKLDSRPQR